MRKLTFEYKGFHFVVQAFLVNDFANICEINGDSFRITFYDKKITTSGKESKDWIAKKALLNPDEIHSIIKNIMICRI